MRSNMFMAGISASLLTLSMGGAYAAEHRLIHSHSGAFPVTTSEPNLNIVLDQLNSTVDGIKIAMVSRQLPASQVQKLDSDAAKIRQSAQNVAAKNGGKLPAAEYDSLLKQVGQLNAALNPPPPAGIVQEDNG